MDFMHTTQSIPHWLKRRIVDSYVLVYFFVDCALAMVFLIVTGQLFASFARWAKQFDGTGNAIISMQWISPNNAVGQILSVVLVTGMTSYAVYRMRCPATAGERQVAWAAFFRAKTWLWLVLGSLSVIAVNALVTHWLTQMGIAINPTNGDLIRQAIRQSPTFLLLFVVIIAPLYEELLFRRVLFGRFSRAGQHRMGLCLSSTAFAVIHEIPGHSMNGWAVLFSLWFVYGAIGCILAIVYQRTQALWVSVVVHGCNNLVALLQLIYG